jgi:hypothetical protein
VSNGKPAEESGQPKSLGEMLTRYRPGQGDDSLKGLSFAIDVLTGLLMVGGAVAPHTSSSTTP